MLIANLTWRRIDWAVTNAAVVIFVVSGVGLGIPTAANTFKFLAWFVYLAPILAIFSESVQIARRKSGPAVPWRISLFVDITLACLLAAYGWFGYAALVAAGGVCGVASYQPDLEKVDAQFEGLILRSIAMLYPACDGDAVCRYLETQGHADAERFYMALGRLIEGGFVATDKRPHSPERNWPPGYFYRLTEVGKERLAKV